MSSAAVFNHTFYSAHCFFSWRYATNVGAWRCFHLLSICTHVYSRPVGEEQGSCCWSYLNKKKKFRVRNCHSFPYFVPLKNIFKYRYCWNTGYSFTIVCTNMPYIPKVQASESCKLLFLQCKKTKKPKQIKKPNNRSSFEARVNARLCILKGEGGKLLHI